MPPKKSDKDAGSVLTTKPTETPAVRKVKQISMLEHVKTRSMWAGSKNIQTIESYVLSVEDGSKVFKPVDLKYPPALLKIIDEIVVNAIDHYVLNPKLVTEIKITVTPEGFITVYNNGPGIQVEKTKNINGVEMYTPQLIFGEFMAGSNFDDSKERIVGGQNGIGSKLTVVFSTEFTIETVDSTNKLKYRQVFRDGLTKIDPPELEPVNATVKPYTKITFMPDYTEFKLNPIKFNKTLHELMQTRAWQAAAYTNAKVYFNGNLIPLKSFADFCQMFSENLIYSTTMTRSKSHPWDVCFAVSDGKERQISIVNGVFMPKGGTHIHYIQKQLVENLRENVEKAIKKSGVKFNKNYITNNVFIFMKGPIPSPEFLSQTKEAISDPIEKFAGYEVPTNEWRKIWELLEPAILATFLKKQLGDVKTRANRGKVDVPKYKEAKYCRDAKNCHKCGLIVTEGDSASGTADTGLLAKASDNFSYDWFGVFSIGGVPMNGLKESVELTSVKKNTPKKKSTDDSDIKPIKRSKKVTALSSIDEESIDVLDEDFSTNVKAVTVAKSTTKKSITTTTDDFNLPVKRAPNAKILKNDRICCLVKVLGLDYNKSYDLTEIGEKEWKTLRYGFIVGLTDQDLDGFNIFGLLSTYLITYWPALLKRNFIRRINTPVIRAYPKNKKKETVKEFYSERAFKEWAEDLGESARSKYKLNYYKGLGSHKQAFKEVSQMFKNIETKIKTYVFDESTFKNMQIYYGKETANRKIVLADPNIAEYEESLSMPMSQQFCVDTKLFQRDNIVRKLLSEVDGFVSSRRKVFYVARKNGNNEIKVQGLAGKAVADANYHHGEASLEQTIIRMAQGYQMARNLPLLLPLGNFGTRGKGYKDAAASRYIFTMINHRLADKMFRKEDDYILDYEVEDGNRYEPKYYMPIVPYVLLENNQLPATGWAIDVHARDINAVFKNIRDMISGVITKCRKLPPWLNGFKGTIKTYKQKNYYVGVYAWLESENAIHITELPPGSYSNAYLRGADDDKIKKKADDVKKGIQTKEWVEDYEDNTTFESVDIMIYLKPGAFDAISEKYGNEVIDPFEDYFELTEVIHHHINLVNWKQEVVEYKNYEDVFDSWFAFRRNLYAIRVERELILNDLEIKMLQNMQRFSISHDTYGITNKISEDEASVILKTHKYDILNHVLLESPKFTSVKKLIELITLAKHGASYDYLLRMSYRDLTEDAYTKRDKKIKELQNRQVYLRDETGSFPGAKIWLKELEELESAITSGMATGWFYGENEYTFEE
jgi:DNA gyrase/topoisomerase IV subunit B